MSRNTAPDQSCMCRGKLLSTYALCAVCAWGHEVGLVLSASPVLKLMQVIGVSLPTIHICWVQSAFQILLLILSPTNNHHGFPFCYE
jgi:hypothetical protein